MADLFDKNGCLTNEALRLLVEEALPEESRLEAAEHLSFCDSCLERYTEVMCGVPLLQPLEPVYPTVWKKIKDRTRVIFLHKFTSAAVAAGMAMVFWVGGVFTPEQDNMGTNLLDFMEEGTYRISSAANQISDNVNDAFNKLFYSFNLRGEYNNEKK